MPNTWKFEYFWLLRAKQKRIVQVNKEAEEFLQCSKNLKLLIGAHLEQVKIFDCEASDYLGT